MYVTYVSNVTYIIQFWLMAHMLSRMQIKSKCFIGGQGLSFWSFCLDLLIKVFLPISICFLLKFYEMAVCVLYK